MFDHIELASDAQPPGSLPPASWAAGTGRQSIERIQPRSHLSMYAVVSMFNVIFRIHLANATKGGLWLRMRATAVHG